MEIFYHGSHNLFDSFDLSHALEGDGKVKFGYGVYVTSRYTSAAHYSGSNPQSNDHYVYTVEVPDKTEGNCIAFKQPVDGDLTPILRQDKGPKLTATDKEKSGAVRIAIVNHIALVHPSAENTARKNSLLLNRQTIPYRKK